MRISQYLSCGPEAAAPSGVRPMVNMPVAYSSKLP